MKTICLEVWGDFALFTRPEFKAERVSYEVMTPTAAVGLLESIYWHPGVKYVIERIRVCNPIRTFNIRRNERSALVSARKGRAAMESGNAELARSVTDSIVQRGNTVLKDVRYVIEAHIEMEAEKAGSDDSLSKYYAIFNRRAEKGQCFKQPVFGIREYAAHFKPCEKLPDTPEDLYGTRYLGQMIHHLDYSNPENIRAVFFDAILVDGVLSVPEDPRDSDIKSIGGRTQAVHSEAEEPRESGEALPVDPCSGNTAVVRKVGNKMITLRLRNKGRERN